MRRLYAPVLFFLILALGAALPAAGQTTGSVRGQITDQDGGTLPGVTVALTGDLVRAERNATTGESGSFSFSAVPVGVVAVEARLEGFRAETIEDLRIGIDTTANLTIVLKLETIAETVTVTSSAPIVDVTSSSVSTNFTSDFIEDLPTDRNFWDMVSLAPGINPSSESDAFRVNAFGSGTSSNAWHIDGLDTTATDTGSSWWWINPDTVAEVQVMGIGLPAEYGAVMGAAINVVTKSGTNELQGALRWYEQPSGLASSNASVDFPGIFQQTVPIDPGAPKIELAAPQAGVGHERDGLTQITATLGGPLKRDRLWFFLAYESYDELYTEPGVPADLVGDFPYETDRYDIKLTASLSSSSTLELKGHYDDYNFNWPTSPDAFSLPKNTGVEFGTNPAWGALFQSVLTNSSFLEVHYAGWEGNDNWASRTGEQEAAFVDWTQPVPVSIGGIPYPWEYDLTRDQGDLKVSHFAEDFLAGDHEFKFGVSYTEGSAKTKISPGEGGNYYYLYAYYGYYYTYYYNYSQRAHYYGSEQETISAFVDDSWQVNEKLTFNLGVRFDQDDARIPPYAVLDFDGNPTGEVNPGLDNVLDWSTVSPRIGFAYRIGEKSVLRGSYGKYYEGSVSGNWNWPPPNMPSIQISFGAWATGQGLENAGPYTIFNEITSDDIGLPDIDPPETDQFALGFERQVGKNMSFGVQGIYKESKNLIGWEILGDGVYDFVTVTNPVTGQDLVLASIVEQPTIRKGNRPGDGSLAPEGARYDNEYKGAFLTFNKRYADGWSLMSSYTWSEATGRDPRAFSQSQGDPFYGSSEGADPNAHINADQLLQGDREHVFQLQTTVELPWSLLGTAIFTYQDGRPYNLRDRFSLDQGITTVILEPASGDLRLPSQTILDVSLGRRFALGKQAKLNLDFQLFNVFNEDAHDFWFGFAYDRGDFIPTTYVLPRRVMIELGIEF